MKLALPILILWLATSSSVRAQQSITWQLDNLKQIGGNPITVTGKPRGITDNGAKALSFDGKGDAILVSRNPIAGTGAFTIEAIFRPEAGGEAEQRWLHVQEDGADNRALLEIRLSGNEWFLDTFIKSGEHRLTLYADKFKHPVDRWYHVALVFDGSTMRHYVDGREEMSGPLTTTPFGPGKTSIGVRMNQVNWFKGAIRQVRFTQRALKPDEFMSQNRERQRPGEFIADCRIARRIGIRQGLTRLRPLAVLTSGSSGERYLGLDSYDSTGSATLMRGKSVTCRTDR